MRKKAILSTLLVSSALLGTATMTNAATSGLKDESKLVMIKKDGVKLYKNSKLKDETKVARGTIYKVNGFREFNHKKYYRVYQENAKGKLVYKGYILSKDTQELKVVSVAKKDCLVGLTKDHQPAWKDLSLTKKMKTYNGTKHSSNFEVKQAYKLGKKTYFSLYRGKEWMGYMDASAFKVLTTKKVEKQHYIVTKNIKTYNDIYFTAKGKLEKGQKVTVKRSYTFTTGREYGSVYSEEGQWLGYATMRALKAVDNSHEKAPERPALPVKPVLPNKPSVPEKDKEERPEPKPITPERPKVPETKPVVSITKEEVQAFIKEAKELAKDNSGFDNEKEFQEAVEKLEQLTKELSNHHKNNEPVIAAMKKVYQMMVDDLKFVYDRSLPWNDSQEGNNPKLKKMEVLSVVPDKEDVDDLIKQGKDLTKEQFTKFMFDKLPKVGDYYTANSYEPFAKALVKAKKLLTEAKTKAVPTATEAKTLKDAMKSLVDTQQKLRFDRQKMIDLLLDIKKACQKWETEQGKLAAMNLTYLAEVKAHADAADRGANTLAAELGYSLKDEKDHYAEEKEKHQPFSSKEYVDRLLMPNKDNAGKLSQLLYLAVNDYYRYISTVKWSAEENKFVADESK